MAASLQTKTIRLSASFRTLAGAKQLDLPLKPDATVRDMLEALVEAKPMLAEKLFDAEGRLNHGIQVLLNGRHVDFLQGESTPIGDTRDVLIIPPVSGG
jgi:molybdopterin synthase sulfur carrier subunit